MSPLKRTRRATSKQRSRGRHARTVEAIMEPLRWPNLPDVPPELVGREYEFPKVLLPASRPLVGRQVLADLAADDTQPIEGLVLDEQPQPAHAEGLEPIPVPSQFFLNAAAQPLRNGVQFPTDPEPTGVILRADNALPADLTAPELMLLGRPIPDDAPDAARPALPVLPPPVRRSREHQLLFGAFDIPFWDQLDRIVLDAHRGEYERAAAYEARERDLLERLHRLECAHQGFIEQVAAEEYRGRLADTIRPLPKRTPGAALAAIEAGELVTA